MKDLRRAVMLLSLATFLPGTRGIALERPAAPQPIALAAEGQKKQPGLVDESGLHNATLWHDPGRIAGLDLLNGPGGAEGKPEPPFSFEREVRSAKPPQIEVSDAQRRKWNVELGRDARPEVAASRLLWAVGYLTDDDYVMWKAAVNNLRIRNAKHYVYTDRKRRHGIKGPYELAGAPDSYLQDVRFARMYDGQKSLGMWSWRSNVFSGTREMNGLRVMLALLNCWDLKDADNPVLVDPRTGTEQFRVSGLASSFGNTGPHLFRGRSRDNSKAYAHSRFITRVSEETVDFATPARSYNPFSFLHRNTTSTTWIGRDIRRDDARWIASLLLQLSHKQIEDAFWAAGYSASEVNVYAHVVETRIRALSEL